MPADNLPAHGSVNHTYPTADDATDRHQLMPTSESLRYLRQLPLATGLPMNRPTRNTLFGCVLCLILAAFYACGARAANYSNIDFDSANYLLPKCEHSLTNNASGVWDGLCTGISSTLWAFGSVLPANVKFCPPKGSTAHQTTRIIVEYLKRHPETLQEPYRFLAVDALHEAWPCK